MKTLLFQGDSITDCARLRECTEPNSMAGLGPGYPGLIAAWLLSRQPERQWRIFNRGISGNRIVDLYARWQPDTLQLNPDFLCILIGINDTWHGKRSGNGVTVSEYDEFYRRLLNWTLKSNPNVRFILMEPFLLPFGEVETDWQDEVDARRDVVRIIALDFGAIWVPLQEKIRTVCRMAPQEYWLVDGVHPTSAGHGLVAAEWLARVEEAGLLQS